MQGEVLDNGNLIAHFDFNSFQPFVDQSRVNIAVLQIEKGSQNREVSSSLYFDGVTSTFEINLKELT